MSFTGMPSLSTKTRVKKHKRFVTSYHFHKKQQKLTIQEIRNKTPLQNLTWLEAPATNHTSKLTVEAGLGVVEWFSTASNTPRAFPSLKLTVSPPFSHPTRKRSSSNNQLRCELLVGNSIAAKISWESSYPRLCPPLTHPLPHFFCMKTRTHEELLANV